MWSNWSGAQRCEPRETLHPRDEEEVAAAVRRDGPVRVAEIPRADATFARPLGRAALCVRLDELLQGAGEAPQDDPHDLLVPHVAAHS